MENSKDRRDNKNVAQTNSSDTLLAIHILHILKKYSSPQQSLSVQEVLRYLNPNKDMGEKEENAQRKKIRRYLDTLTASYGNGCIIKEEGMRRDGHRWYYDASRDSFANEERPVRETLTNEEIEFIVDIIASSKIINAGSTEGIIKKLLRKTDFSKEKRNKKWASIRGEVWPKSVNEELVKFQKEIQAYIDSSRRIRFDYEDKKSVLATPYGWDSKDGKYILIAKIDGAVQGQFSSFALEKIRNARTEDIDYDIDDTYFDRDDKEPDDDISLESLFANIGKINAAIEDGSSLAFEYLSYMIKDEVVDFVGKSKLVLPRSLVFTDGKYYLIGFDQNAEDKDKQIGYYRVDLISKLSLLKTDNVLSDWDQSILEGIDRARAVDMHPLMYSGKDCPVVFKVVESALDRVIDAFGKNARFEVTNETRKVPLASASQKPNKSSSPEEFTSERIVKVSVRTTFEEAFRWSLANADVVEVCDQDIRNRLGRIADPIYHLYTQTLPDKVRENIDYISDKGIFRIARSVDEATALATYEELRKNGKIDNVDNIFVRMDSGEPKEYLGNFSNAKVLRMNYVPECKNLTWASGLTNLEALELIDTQIENVSWLRDLKNLRQLEISDTPVSDLSMLSEHTDIRELHLCNTNVCDISFIENYRYLSWVSLIGCPIKDYSPLFKLPSYLKLLEIDEQAARKIDINSLKQCHIGIDIIVQ